jgi:hypothetical protein
MVKPEGTYTCVRGLDFVNFYTHLGKIPKPPISSGRLALVWRHDTQHNYIRCNVQEWMIFTEHKWEWMILQYTHCHDLIRNDQEMTGNIFHDS